VAGSVVVLVVVVVFNPNSLLPAVAPINHGILPSLDGNTRRRDRDHGGGIPPTVCGGTTNITGSSGRSGGGGGGSGGGGNSKWRTMQPLSPFSTLEALAKESTQKKEKAEKFYFYLRQQLLRKMNLDPIFSESIFGTIANKNKKRITAGTQCPCCQICLVRTSMLFYLQMPLQLLQLQLNCHFYCGCWYYHCHRCCVVVYFKIFTVASIAFANTTAIVTTVVVIIGHLSSLLAAITIVVKIDVSHQC
jgi:hypothetical protein